MATTSLKPKDQLDFPWAEYTGEEGQMDASFAAAGDSRASMIFEIEQKDFNSDTPGDILGWAARGNAKIERHLPIRHPRFNWLWANTVSSMKGLGYNGQAGLTGATNYKRYLMTIGFSTLPYFVLADSEITYEYERFVEGVSQSKTELLASGKGDWKISDTTATGTGGRVANGSNLPGARGRKHMVRRFKWTWHRVPPPWVQTKWGRTSQIDDVVGRINAGTWPDAQGFPAGTLLFEDPEFIPEVAPVAPARVWRGAFGGLRTDRHAPILYKIVFNLAYFNPKTDSTTKGWNLFLASDGEFYNGIRTVSGSTKRQYDTTDLGIAWQKIT